MSTPSEVAALVAASNTLTQTVIDHRSEITNTVTEKITQLDAWKAGLTPQDVQAEPRYHHVIDLTGLPVDRFYPVWWDLISNSQTVHRITLARTYSDDRELEPFGPGVQHLAGLLLEMEQVGGTPSGDANFLTTKRLHQSYRHTVRGISYGMKTSSVHSVPGYPLPSWVESGYCGYLNGLYLRGGLHYHWFSNIIAAPDYSLEQGEVHLETRLEEGLLGARWMVRSYHIDETFLGADYSNVTVPYSAPALNHN